MIKGYLKSSGKIPLYKEENRTLLSIPPDTGDYGALYNSDVIRIDIDDFNHHTGEPEEFIKGKPRSEAVLKYLNSLNYKYNAIKTENGIHIIMKIPINWDNVSNKNNWYCPLGISIELHVTKVFEPIVINGTMRKFIKGDLLNKDVDELPKALYPLQKSKEKPFHIFFESGNRNSHLSEYAFYLVNKGYSTNDIKEIITSINQFILEEPLPEDELHNILRYETVEKLKAIEKNKEEKNVSHVQIGNEVIEHFNIITANGEMYQYKSGVYVPISTEAMGKYIRMKHPSIKKAMKEESISFIQDITYSENNKCDSSLINVKNGLLKLNDLSETVNFISHFKEHISFQQFNAEYDPEAKSEVLDHTIQKFFDFDNDIIKLFKQMLGYLLMSNTVYQKCFFFVGMPSSGKSKILNMISAFCGKSYVSSLSIKELDDKFRAACIVDKIANINADLEKTRIQSSGNFKSFVTGDSVTLERKYSKPFSHISNAKLIFASNQNPDFSKDSEGIFRRVIVFPCNHVFSKNDKDFNPRIDEDLQTKEALSTLLNWAIEGYFDLIKNGGFIEPDAVIRANEEFKTDSNNVFRWIRENNVTEEMLLIKPIREDLYFDYKRFCVKSGEEAKEQKDFSRTICNEFKMVTFLKRSNGKRLRFFKNR